MTGYIHRIILLKSTFFEVSECVLHVFESVNALTWPVGHIKELAVALLLSMNYLVSQNLSFFISRIGMIIPILKSCWKNWVRFCMWYIWPSIWPTVNMYWVHSLCYSLCIHSGEDTAMKWTASHVTCTHKQHAVFWISALMGKE